MSYFRANELMEILAQSKTRFFVAAKDQSWPYEDRPGNGGMLRFFGPLEKLPADVQKAIYRARPELNPAAPKAELDWAQIFTRHARLNAAQKAVGAQRALGMRMIEDAVKKGESVLRAIQRLEPETGVSKGDYYRYIKRVDGVAWQQWPMLLTSQYSEKPRRRSESVV